VLEELVIQNYALIEKASVRFQPGFNVLTGETGAGKSILIGALGLLLGSKADSDVIRAGCEEALATGVFSIAMNSELESWFVESGLPLPEDSLVVRRSLRPQKRGSCHLGGTPVTRAQLEDLTSYLVDLHGQHEHQSLFSSEHQRRLLDRFAALDPDLENFAASFQELSRRKKNLESLAQLLASREAETERLKALVSEVRKVDPKRDEEDELKAEKLRLDQHERLWEALNTFVDSFENDRTSILPSLRQVKPALSQVTEIAPELATFLGRFDAAYYELEDLVESLAAYKRQLQFSPERLEFINERLSLLHGLEKRWGPGIEGVLANLEQAESQLKTLEGGSENLERLEVELAEQEQLVIQKALLLSEKRAQASRDLEKKILLALGELGMAKARFQIVLSRKIGDSGNPICSVTGLDQVEFMWAANLGENLAPLRDTASGGELSRLMLALKTILSDADKIPILIFDEIDTGIGGEIGQALGRYLKRLSQRKQVLCITHLASIAAWADHHLRVEKSVDSGRTTTRVEPVFEEERILEIARMLSGGTSPAGIEHAKELIAASRLEDEDV
jgi:DNA repair protein RecN (Recombination protein N)